MVKSGLVVGLALLVAAGFCFPGEAADGRASEPVRIIFDTDMFDDYDDVGALALLNRFADLGEAKILATTSCTRGNSSVAMIEVVNAYYGRPDIPVGCTKELGESRRLGAPGTQSRSRHAEFERLAKKYARWVRHADSETAPDALSVWRKALAESPDSSVAIVTAGYTTNVRRLLESGPDEISPLNGVELAKRKAKVWVAMACWYPKGTETNSGSDPESSRIAFEKWPGDILFSDFQYGRDIYCGRKVAESAVAESPVKDAFAAMLPSREQVRKGDPWYKSERGQCSWDESVVLAAVRPDAGIFGVQRGYYRMIVGTKDNVWTDDPKSGHGRIVPKWSNDRVGELLDDLIAQRPGIKGEM